MTSGADHRASGAPHIVLPAELREQLALHGSLERATRFLETAPRRCTYVTSERVTNAPLRRGTLARMLGLRTTAPKLSPFTSKLGGIPYATEALRPARDARFLGQLSFADVADPPELLPRAGILAVDLGEGGLEANGFHVRWYPEPRDDAFVAHGVDSVGAWETALRFRPGWSLPRGRTWDEVVGSDRGAVWDAWNGFSPDGYDEDERDECHRVLGHRAAGLDEHYGLEPRDGGSGRIEDYEMLWRLTFDNAAGVAWGTNWVHVLVEKRDLEAGRLDRAIIVGSNY